MKTFRQLAAIFLLIAGLLVLANVSATPQDDIEKYPLQIQQNPNDVDAYYKRGETYRNLGQYTLAIQDYNKIIAINPNFSEPHTIVLEYVIMI